VGPTTTVVTSTTVRSTTTSVAQARVTPVQSSSTTVAQTTTTRAISPLSVGSPSGSDAGSSFRWTVGVGFSTDPTALPQRVCWTVMVNGVAASGLEVSSSDLNGPQWTDAGGSCATYARTTRSFNNSYNAYVTFQYRGASYDPMPYQLRTWVVKATVTDTLGRSAETPTYTRNL